MKLQLPRLSVRRLLHRGVRVRRRCAHCHQFAASQIQYLEDRVNLSALGFDGFLAEDWNHNSDEHYSASQNFGFVTFDAITLQEKISLHEDIEFLSGAVAEDGFWSDPAGYEFTLEGSEIPGLDDTSSFFESDSDQLMFDQLIGELVAISFDEATELELLASDVAPEVPTDELSAFPAEFFGDVLSTFQLIPSDLENNDPVSTLDLSDIPFDDSLTDDSELPATDRLEPLLTAAPVFSLHDDLNDNEPVELSILVDPEGVAALGQETFDALSDPVRFHFPETNIQVSLSDTHSTAEDLTDQSSEENHFPPATESDLELLNSLGLHVDPEILTSLPSLHEESNDPVHTTLDELHIVETNELADHDIAQTPAIETGKVRPVVEPVETSPHSAETAAEAALETIAPGQTSRAVSQLSTAELLFLNAEGYGRSLPFDVANRPDGKALDTSSAVLNPQNPATHEVANASRDANDATSDSESLGQFEVTLGSTDLDGHNAVLPIHYLQRMQDSGLSLAAENSYPSALSIVPLYAGIEERKPQTASMAFWMVSSTAAGIAFRSRTVAKRYPEIGTSRPAPISRCF